MGSLAPRRLGKAVFGERRQEQIRLTRAQADKVILENECTRKTKIPMEIVNHVDDQVLRAMAAIIKNNRDKVLPTELINELFAQLRGIPVKLNWPGVKEVPLD